MSVALALPEDDIALLAELEDAAAIERKLEADRLRGDLYEFVKAAWYIIDTRPFVDAWHLKAICRELEDAFFQRTTENRFIFNVPPGTAKSMVITVLFPAWVWTHKPHWKFLCASYGQHLSTRDNLRCRTVVTSAWYRELFGDVQLSEDENNKTKYATSAGGWRIATSVGGPGTGEHPHFIIIDDPTTSQQAKSETERVRANQWFDDTMSSRGLTLKVKVFLVQQRQAVEDLSGHMIKRGGKVRTVVFPMRYEPARAATDERPAYAPDPRDARKIAGELLCPQLIDEDAVKQLEIDLGPYDAAAQLQQQPTEEVGSLFKRTYFADKFLDVMPKNLIRSCRGWDTAGTENAGDFTAGVRIDEFEPGKFLVSNVVHGQLGPEDVEKLLLMTAKADGKECVQREEREGGSSGPAIIAAHTKLLVGYDHKGVLLGSDKVTRAKPFRAQCASGNVYLLRGPWNETYLSELCSFPTAKHDDQVDASSAAFNSILLEPKRKVKLTW